MTAADAQFLESRTFSVDEVGRWFGVPPHLLGLTEKATSWGQGIAEQNRGLARYTLQPWTSRIEQRLTRLISDPKRRAEFDYSTFVKPSPEDDANLTIAQVNAGILTLNEGRKRQNLPPLPADTGADLPRVPAGAAPPTVPAADNPPVAAGTTQGGEPSA
jgi:HK97 family phage portal protein